jgi:hypothetical protein
VEGPAGYSGTSVPYTLLILIVMEEPRERYTVIFALIVTEPASECVPVTTHEKTTVLSSPDSSMLIAAHKYAASAR